MGNVFEWPLIRRMLSYTRPYRGWFILSVVLTIAGAALTPVKPMLVEYVLDGPVADGDKQQVLVMILIILSLLLFSALLEFLTTLLTNWLGQSIIRDIRIQVFAHIKSLRLAYFDKTPVGTLQTRTISDVETLNDVFSQGIVNIMGEMLQLVAILGVMFWTSWKLTLVVLTTLPLLLGATWIFKTKVKAAFQTVRKYVSLMNAFLQEHITGMVVTQLFSREKKEYEKFQDLNKAYTRANLDSVLAYSVFFPVVEVISAVGIAMLVWYGAGSVLAGELTFGILVSFIMYINLFFRPIRMLADQFNTLQMGMVSAERIFKVLDTDEKIEDAGELNTLPVPAAGIPAVEFSKVSFSYNDSNWVLQDVSFEVPHGKKVAIVGATGAGKSTIISLLTRFYELNRGSIRLHGTDIATIRTSALRTGIGTVLQDVFLFSGTILDNITLNNPSISREIAIEAAKHVGADSFISNLPGQYDYNVMERGATLSSGQRQLIAFARVLVYDPEILVLDEATSNIDSESEELIQIAIEKVLSGRTSIIIAHRLSTIQKADQIIVLSKGKISEQGTHNELIQSGGLYHKLYQLQFVGV